MATRHPPAINADTEFFWNGLRKHTLLIQRCKGCGAARNPPQPMCPKCRSLKWDYPYIVALIQLDENVRLVSNLTDIDPADVHFDGELVLHQFRPYPEGRL